MTKRDIELYQDVAYEQAEQLTKRYSTSFSRAISLMDASKRKHIYAVYGMVRLADEIVDAGFAIDAKKELDAFTKDIDEALEARFSSNLVLHAFQDTVHSFAIDRELIKSFLHSMELDIDKKEYDQSGYETYIYGSAEVVGLMCLAVFCDGNKALYKKLLKPARALGSAFQKVNFLRDIRSDGLERGRTYFPGVDLENFSEEDKRAIEGDIQKEYAIAAEVIPELPGKAAMAVDAALELYRELLRHIEKTPADELLKKRVRVSDLKKVQIGIKIWLKYVFKK